MLRKGCKSLADHPLMAEFHSTKNGSLDPHVIAAGTPKRIWWQCGKCGYEWHVTGHDRAKHGSGCPACQNRIVTDWNCMATTHPELAMEFHPSKNGNLSPATLVAGTHKRLWWQCRKCGYEWQVVGNSRVRYKSGCPACSNKQVTSWNNMTVTHPRLASQFHPTKNGALTPHDFVAHTRTVLWWKCHCGYEWRAAGSSRARCKRYECKRCASKRYSTIVRCVICGDRIKRWLSFVRTDEPTCSVMCADVLFYRRRLKNMVYRTRLLKDMLLFEGDGCAMPGCMNSRSASKNNQWHACEIHRVYVMGLIRKYRWARSRAAQD
ncbi:MAG: hypothetical protein G01um101470_724 [Parcubacteria group bacterium Gr01-1014_70]|nr:MAG: hypothetical protein G01um101470_724 [Parcubacteria group bacterium Gr01-1014_70]